jgi:hypothetical protein
MVLAYWLEPCPRPRGHRTLQEVANFTKIPLSTLEKWSMPRNRERIFAERAGLRCVQPSKPKWPLVEDRLHEEFLKMREMARPVRLRWFRVNSKRLYNELYPTERVGESDFLFSTGVTLRRDVASEKPLTACAGWFLNFLHRCRISIRRPTHKGPGLPRDYTSAIINFVRFCRRNSHQDHRSMPYPDALLPHLTVELPPADINVLPDLLGVLFPGMVCNMDQTPMPFEFLEGRTYATKGAKHVQLQSTKSGWDRRQATLMLTIFADGIARIPPIIIFHGLSDSERKRPRNEREQQVYNAEHARYHPGVVVLFNKEAYCNEEVTLWWLKTYLIPTMQMERPVNTDILPGHTSPLPEYPSMLALDVVRFQRTEQVNALLRTHNIIPACIPANCTGYLQPLDVCFNSPFKKHLKYWMDDSLQRLEDEEEEAARHGRTIAKDSAVGERRVLVTHGVGEVWTRFCAEKRNMIIHSFQKTGIALPIDGSLDDRLSVDIFPPEHPLEVGNWTTERKADGTDAPLPDTLLRTRYEESPPYGDTAGAPVFDTNADGEITDGDEADTVYTAQVITDHGILIIFSGAVTAPRGEVTQPRGTVTAPLKIIFEIVFHAWPFPVGYC